MGQYEKTPNTTLLTFNKKGFLAYLARKYVTLINVFLNAISDDLPDSVDI